MVGAGESKATALLADRFRKAPAGPAVVERALIGDDDPVIVRMWETPVKSGQIDALIEYVMAEVWPGVTAAEGFVSGEVLRSFGEGGDRLLLVTRWKDTESLSGFLGPDWQAHQMTPVTDEEPLLAGSPFVDHWDLVTTVGASG